MATIETLIAQIDNVALRERLGREVAEMKKRLDWGLVFERHLPENVRALSAPIKAGTVVWERRSTTPRRLRVRAVHGQELVVVAEPEKTTAGTNAPTERVALADVLVELDFAEGVFPVLTPIGSICHGPAGRRYHAVIQGENYHAIQALLAGYERAFDIIYLDPPYNTGNRDWSYNNDHVDPNDTYRPSKWLAFMERRLRVARRLLRPDGVLVVTIDENEVHHLGMLLDQLFPEAMRQMVTICINPSGASADGLSRVDEYAHFLFFGGSQPSRMTDDLLGPEQKTQTTWESLLRRGSSWTRQSRPNLCYPVVIDAGGRIVDVGNRLEGPDEDRPLRLGDNDLAWPVRSDGKLGIWRVDPVRLRALSGLGYAYATKRDQARGTWSLRYLLDGAIRAIERGELEIVGRGAKNEAILRSRVENKMVAKTMWHRGRHTAGGSGGTQLLTACVGKRNTFSYPKSVYAVRDTLEVAVGDRTDALILDFFAGSGTTLHAAMLLNARDDGTRRCVLVTNNEVTYQAACSLNAKGHFVGDREFEAAGVFEAACRPRVTAAVTGVRPDGRPVEGQYEDGREYAEGFGENVEFYRLDYLDPAEVEFGLRFAELHPLLWLRAGGIAEREAMDPSQPLGLPSHSPYAVLFDPSGLPRLLAALPTRPDVTHVFIVADSAESFAQIVADLPREIRPVRLYRDYLETIRGATR